MILQFGKCKTKSYNKPKPGVPPTLTWSKSPLHSGTLHGLVAHDHMQHTVCEHNFCDCTWQKQPPAFKTIQVQESVISCQSATLVYYPQIVMYLDVPATHRAYYCSNVAVLSKAAVLICFKLRMIFTPSVAMLSKTAPWQL